MSKRQQIWKSLKDKIYRRAFSDDVGTSLAFQTRLMREKRGWTQEELGNRAGMKQEYVSQLESPAYGRHSLTTLKKLAAAFDVALIVRFAPFSELVDWVSSVDERRLIPLSYEEEHQQLSFADVSGPLHEWTDLISRSEPTFAANMVLGPPELWDDYSNVVVMEPKTSIMAPFLNIYSTGESIFGRITEQGRVRKEEHEFTKAA